METKNLEIILICIGVIGALIICYEIYSYFKTREILKNTYSPDIYAAAKRYEYFFSKINHLPIYNPKRVKKKEVEGFMECVGEYIKLPPDVVSTEAARIKQYLVRSDYYSAARKDSSYLMVFVKDQSKRTKKLHEQKYIGFGECVLDADMTKQFVDELVMKDIVYFRLVKQTKYLGFRVLLLCPYVRQGDTDGIFENQGVPEHNLALA